MAKCVLTMFASNMQADREAYVSGHEPRRRYAPREHAESLALMGEYLSGQRSEPPVEAFGADRAPKLGDKEVNLRQLYALVRDYKFYSLRKDLD